MIIWALLRGSGGLRQIKVLDHSPIIRKRDRVLESETGSAERLLMEMTTRDFHPLRELVHRHTGIWLQDGKRTMLAARLARIVRRLGLTNFQAYYSLLRNCAEDSPEFTEFVNAITTNKTSFFREKHHFDYLRQTIVPEIKASAARGGRKQIRIWSAACSTGEEVYSIALTLLEAVPESGWRLEVVGSDIDTGVLAVAQSGIYSEEGLRSVDEPLHQRYFLRGRDSKAGQVKLRPEVTRLIDLRRVNLMDKYWPVHGPFDVIFFRNALIYFQQDVQDVFLRKMAPLLRPGGYLFLGNSEQISWMHEVFEPLNQTMYRLRGARE